ncbi:MAG: hypothetical protein ACTTKX_09085 [Treponema sp.]
MDSDNTDIAKRCEDLGIIAFDCAESADKEDVIIALNAIEADINIHSDEARYKHIKNLQNAKKYRGVPKI